MKDANTFKVDCTVILCCKNAETSIRQCIESILENQPRFLIVIDGNSSDRTIEVISSMGISHVQGLGKGLTADRQLGIDLSQSTWSFFIDADHILPSNFLSTMKNTIEAENYTLIQSRLKLWNPKGMLNKGEDCYYELVHNATDENIIPGIAPAIFRTNQLKSSNTLAIDDGITATIDDTNWAIKAQKTGAKIGIQGPKVWQLHSSSILDYYKKFKWYGIGDGEFCHGQPQLRRRHYFHLLIRYPVIYSARSIRKKLHKAIPFLVMQGLVRGFWCVKTDLSLKHPAD